MKILKIYIALSIVLINSSDLNSQIYFEPSIFIENLNIMQKGALYSADSLRYISLNDRLRIEEKNRFLEPYYHRSYLFNFRILRKINSRIDISVDLNFTKKKFIYIKAVDFNIPDFVRIYDFGLKKFGFSFGFDYDVTKLFYLKLGFGIDKINIDEKIYQIIENTYSLERVNQRIQLNFNTGIGYLYKNFFLELNYVNGFSYIWGGTNLFHPTNSINLGLGYRIKIYPIKKNKNVDCPKF